ncbi:response regulator transcription factor [Brachybacterium sp. AOP42-C2-15]|uniref:response regulator transcription factor n=1 Tax=unclassified Brachybacterium TaxID=2623841 RepID=UPI003FD98F98
MADGADPADAAAAADVAGVAGVAGPADAAASIRVLLVDDQELIRYGLRLVLDAQPDIEVVGEASDGMEAVRTARQLLPDVVLMDVRMPGMDGIEATKQLSVAVPDVRVLVLTTYDRDEFAFGALQAGAAGFLLKNTRPDELVAAVRTVQTGDAVISPRVTAKLIELAVPHLPGPTSREVEDQLSLLSEREREVFLLVGRGLTNSEIAQTLHLSESTVKAHFGRILLKLDVPSRVQAVIRAYELGVVSVGE